MSELEKIIGSNMGCYYRETDRKWLREINDPRTTEFSHLIDMTAEVNGTTKAAQNLVKSSNLSLLGRLKEQKQTTRVWDGEELSINFVEAVPLDILEGEMEKLDA